MRAILPLLLLGACAAPPAGGGGIVSVNPCADAILVRLVAPDRIAAISHYSQDPSATSMPIEMARRFRSTAGTAEEVIALDPSLVLASSFTSPATRDAFARAGLKTVYLDSPQTIAASEAQVMQVADAVGTRARGRALVTEIEASLPPPRRTPGPSWENRSDAAQRPPTKAFPPGPRPSPGGKVGARPAALLYIYGDLATGSGTLLDEMLTRSGFTNAAASYGLQYTGRLSAETILTHPPAIVMAPPGGRARQVRRALLPDTPEATFASDLINCGGPTIPRAMRRLAQIRATL